MTVQSLYRAVKRARTRAHARTGAQGLAFAQNPAFLPVFTDRSIDSSGTFRIKGGIADKETLYSMKSLSRLLSSESIIWLTSDTKDEALRELVDKLATTTGWSAPDEVYQAILDRERLYSTGFEQGLAIPHAKLESVPEFSVGLGIHVDGLEFDSIDNSQVHVLIMIVGPKSRQHEYLQVLSRVTAFMRDNRERLLELKDAEAIYKLTLEY